MLVLHVVDRLTGGVPLAVRDYISNSPDGVDHIILSPYVGTRPSPIWDGLRATQRDLTSDRWSQILAIRRQIERLRPAVIHTHSSFPGALTRVLSIPNVRVVYSPHGFKFDDPGIRSMPRLVYRFIERSLSLRTNCFAVLSAHEEALVRSLNPRASIARIPNVPTLDTRASPARIVSPKVGMVGRLAPQKDPTFFADVATSVREIRSGSTDMVWIGGGNDQLQSQLESAGVTVTGWLDKDLLTVILDSLGVYVHTAKYEGFPLSILDAAARRVPIIARSIPAFTEVSIQTFETPAEAATLISRALGDHDFRARLIANGDRMLSEMNPASQCEALRRVWRME